MGCLGVLCMMIGLGFMGGNTPGLSKQDGRTIGGILMGSGVLIICAGAWKEIAGQKEKRLNREAAIAQVERLADLWKQGALSDEEFAHQKRESLKLADHQPAQVAGLPLTNPTVTETPAFAMIGRMARMWERGALDDDEFAAFKRPFLGHEAKVPTERDVAALAHIERLADFWESGTISDEEFAEQKQKYVEAMDSGLKGLERTDESKPSVPSSWDLLGEP
jgi:hypothetical protein